ncbi:hypothetical protein Tco_0564768 [Tanacetum coccineum]
MEIKYKFDLDQNGTLVDATKYHSMIGALMYLRSIRPYIVHATCLCARYQDKPTEKHLKEVKRIFHYLQGTVNMGLWYTKDSGFELTGFSDSDYAGCKDTFKSTFSGAQFLGKKLVSSQYQRDLPRNTLLDRVEVLGMIEKRNKKGVYDIWAMKMKHYLGHTYYPIWEVIQNGNGLVQVSTDTNGRIRVLTPKTAEEILARERERKARTTLLMSIPENHLAKFHKIADAKEMWEAIKSRFDGNDESNKMQNYILNACVSTEDANQKLLRVFESDIKGSTTSSSSTRNVVFVSSKSTNSTNDVSTTYGVSTSSGHNSQKEGSSSYTDEFKRDGFEMASGHDFHEIEEVLQEDKEKEEPKALVTLDRDGVDWTGHAEDEQENFGLMAHSNSGLNTEVTSCSKECEESYAKLKKLYDEQREQLGVASIEIQAYTQALKKVEAQLVFPPPMTGIYMPSKSDLGIDESKFTYGSKQSKTSESDAKTSDIASCESTFSIETPDSVPKPVVNEPTTVSKSKSLV